jgi:hypothetical protein
LSIPDSSSGFSNICFVLGTNTWKSTQLLRLPVSLMTVMSD